MKVDAAKYGNECRHAVGRVLTRGGLQSAVADYMIMSGSCELFSGAFSVAVRAKARRKLKLGPTKHPYTQISRFFQAIVKLFTSKSHTRRYGSANVSRAESLAIATNCFPSTA